MLVMLHKTGGDSKIIHIADTGDLFENVARALGWRNYHEDDKRHVDPLWFISQHSITKIERLRDA